MSHPATFNIIGQPFITLKSVDSTNNYAMAQAQAGLAQHGAAWFAHEQTSGKGQRGKRWQAKPYENIILSILVTPQGRPFLLSASIALAVFDFFEKYAGEETRIKWPNDLYWRDRKAGGILIENSYRGGDWQFAVVGMGININQTEFDPSLINPVSLKQITGRQFNTLMLAQELCTAVETRYQQLLSAGRESLVRQYEAVLYKNHQPVRLKKDNAVFETTIQGVTANGALVTKDAIERHFEFGEVEWVL